jgi:hypothetical protein
MQRFRTTAGDGTEYLTIDFIKDQPLGIHIAPDKKFGYEGARATTVKYLVNDGQAHKGGVVCAGDILIRVNGEKAHKYPDVIQQITGTDGPIFSIEFFRISRVRLSEMLMNPGGSPRQEEEEDLPLDALIASAKQFFAVADEMEKKNAVVVQDHGLKKLSLDEVPDLATGEYAEQLYESLMMLVGENETGKVGDFALQCKSYGSSAPDEVIECAEELYLYIQSAFGINKAAKITLDMVQLLPDFHKRCALLVQAGLLAPNDMPPIPGAEHQPNKGVLQQNFDKFMRTKNGDKVKKLMMHDRVKLTLPLWVFIPGATAITIAAMGTLVAEEKIQSLKEKAKVEQYWVPDDLAHDCYRCHSSFTLLKRRHHCRRCTNVFCNACTSQRAMLKEQGFTVPVRVCDDCYIDVLNRQTLFVARAPGDATVAEGNRERTSSEASEGNRERTTSGSFMGGSPTKGTGQMIWSRSYDNENAAYLELPQHTIAEISEELMEGGAVEWQEGDKAEVGVHAASFEIDVLRTCTEFVGNMMQDVDAEVLLMVWLCEVVTQELSSGAESPNTGANKPPMQGSQGVVVALALTSTSYFRVSYDRELMSITQYKRTSFTEVSRVVGSSGDTGAEEALSSGNSMIIFSEEKGGDGLGSADCGSSTNKRGSFTNFLENIGLGKEEAQSGKQVEEYVLRMPAGGSK